jgi:hypothetical protein
LNIIRQVRDENEELYQKIKNLPRKAKSGRNNKKLLSDKTLTFVRKGGLKKFFIADEKDSNEIFFLQAMKYLEVDENAKKVKIPKKYFQHLELNKLGFEICLTEEKDVIIDKTTKKGNDAKVIKMLKAISKCKHFTDKEDILINKLRTMWEEGNIPASITKRIIKQSKGLTEPVKILYLIKELVPDKYFEERKNKKKIDLSGDMKVILSLYLKGEI